jgi:excisionase family DNA binding protein
MAEKRTGEVAYLGFPEAASYVGLSIGSLRRLVNAGKITLFRPTPKRSVLSRKDLDLYMESCAATAAK